MNIVTEKSLVPDELFERLRKGNSGSVIFHYAVVKNKVEAKVSSGIRFERCGDMEAEMSEIEADIRNRWDIDDILLVRRIGHLRVGDLISLVAVSAGTSRHAFETCQYGLERIRKMTSLKKKELFME